MKLAYADPPYIGQAKKHYSDDPNCAEVDHNELLTTLSKYDGWALSFGCNTSALKTLIPLLPDTARVAAWVKPFASFKPNVNPAYTWEGVAYQSARPNRRNIKTVKDHLVENITLKKGLAGAKPKRFCLWMFSLIGAEPCDEFVDLFPGTGIVSKMWDEFKIGNNTNKQLELTYTNQERNIA